MAPCWRERVDSLEKAGLRRVNISIDTLDAEKFKRMTKRGDLDKVLEGIFAAKECRLAPIKFNAVVERGVNDDDIIPLVEFSREHGFAMRFIEYMDVGNSNNWTSAKLVAKKEIIEKSIPAIRSEKSGANKAARRRWIMNLSTAGAISALSLR